MVFAFLCHSVGSPCRMLYSAVFGDDLQLAANEVCNNIIFMNLFDPPSHLKKQLTRQHGQA